MPKGEHPFNQLIRGKRKRSKGSLEQALQECWLVIRVCAAARDGAIDDFIQAEDDPERSLALEQVHRFAQLEISALRAYGSLALPADLELRVKAMESKLNAASNTH